MLKPPIGTDHRCVVTFYQVRWKKNKKAPANAKAPKRDFDSMAWQPKKRQEFDGYFRSACTEVLGKDTPETFDELLAAVNKAAESLPEAPERPRPQSISNKMKYVEVLSGRRDERDRQLAQVERLNRDEATTLVNGYVETLKRGNPWTAWMHVFAQEKKYGSAKAQHLTAAKFRDHFEKLLGGNPKEVEDFGLDDMPRPWEREIYDENLYGTPAHCPPPPKFNTAPVTFHELRELARKQRNHTSVGPDGLPATLLKCDTILQALVPIFNDALRDPSKIPSQFFDATLVPLFKKGDPEDTNNYRGISLMSCAAKLFHLVLLHRTRDALDRYISPEQNAYRPSRSCQQHIISVAGLHQLAAKFPDLELHTMFIDFTKAFDSVNRKSLERILRWWTVPEIHIRAMMTMLTEHRLFVRYNGETADSPVQPTAGVLQGDTLAPFLFILCVDIILQHLDKKKGINLGADDTRESARQGTEPRRQYLRLRKYLSHLAYADDVVLIATTRPDLQDLLNQFQEVASFLGMQINLGKGKTEEIRLNAPDQIPVHLTGGRPVTFTTNYKYLGYILGAGSKKCKKDSKFFKKGMDIPLQSWEADHARRTRLGWAIIRRFGPIWSSEASIDAKYNLFQALVEPILSYAAVVYSPSKAAEYRLHTTHHSMLRFCLGDEFRLDFKNWSHPKTEYLYATRDEDRGKKKCLSLVLPAIVNRQRLSAWGHWVRDHYQTKPRKYATEHRVLDVLEFGALHVKSRFKQRRGGQRLTLFDAFTRTIPQPERGADKRTVAHVHSLDARDRKSWFASSVLEVRRQDLQLLKRVLDRRLKHSERDFNEDAYDEAMRTIKNPNSFCARFMTRKLSEAEILKILSTLTD